LPQEIISHTRRFWAERTGKPVSADDAAESIRNVSSLFDLLASWVEADSCEGEAITSDGTPSDASGPMEEDDGSR
jgi:hypothetical protein